MIFKLDSVTFRVSERRTVDFGGLWRQFRGGGAGGQTLGLSCNESMPLPVLQTKGLCKFSLRKLVLFKNIWF